MEGTIEPSCPTNWEYKDIAGAEGALARRTPLVLRIIRQARTNLKDELARDTRPVHQTMFNGLTPEHFPQFAGNYRGSPHRCIDAYEVGIGPTMPGMPRVGHPAAIVPAEMEAFEQQIRRAQEELDLVWSAPDAMFPKTQKFLRTIDIAGAVFVHWLEIHPFANGNGHMARFLLMCLFGRHDLYMNANMPIHPRPQEPAYSNAIVQHRAGNPRPLRQLLMQCF